MGTMGSERRNLEQLRVFFVAGLIMGLIGNISYFLRYKDINIEFFYYIDLNSLSIMMAFSILILGIFSIGNIKLDVNDEILINVKKKTIIYKIICIGYAIFTLVFLLYLKT